MKRAPLKRGQPMKRGGRIKAKGKSRFPKRRDPAFLAFIRERFCCIWDCPAYGEAEIEAAHVKTRGAGGDDIGNAVPLCRKHHREQHAIGIRSFEERHNIDMQAMAAEYARHYLAETGRTA